MNLIENELLSFCKFNIELEIINKPNCIEHCEILKKILKSKFSNYFIETLPEVFLNQNNFKIKQNILINFYENEENHQNFEILTKTHLKLIIGFIIYDKKEKIISNFINVNIFLKNLVKKHF